MNPSLRALSLRTIHQFDKLRLGLRRRFLPGLEIEPGASANFGHARYRLAPGAKLRICRGAVTDRIPGALYFSLGVGAEVVVGEETWLRTEIAPIHIVAFDGARIAIGRNVFLNGCHLSAKSSLRIDRGASVGLGSRVFDADQHDLDDARLEKIEPVHIGEYTWVASEVTILRGVNIGAHSVVGTHSLVTGDIPSHTLAFGQPACSRGPVGDRSNAR